MVVKVFVLVDNVDCCYRRCGGAGVSLFEAVGARFDFSFLRALRPKVFSHLRTFVPPYPRKKSSVPPYLRTSELHRKVTTRTPRFGRLLIEFNILLQINKIPAFMRRLLSEKKRLLKKIWRLRSKIKWYFFGQLHIIYYLCPHKTHILKLWPFVAEFLCVAISIKINHDR